MFWKHRLIYSQLWFPTRNVNFALKARMKLRETDSAFTLTLPDATTNPKGSTIHPLRRPDFNTLFLGAGWSFGWRDGGDAEPRTVKLLGGQVVKGSIKSIALPKDLRPSFFWCRAVEPLKGCSWAPLKGSVKRLRDWLVWHPGPLIYTLVN